MTTLIDLIEAENDLREFELTEENEPEDYDEMTFEELEYHGYHVKWHGFRRRYLVGMAQEEFFDVRRSPTGTIPALRLG